VESLVHSELIIVEKGTANFQLPVIPLHLDYVTVGEMC